ncbi:MAG: hypothetical protein COA78_15675, partial [Blastopirellula sp.]
MAKDFCVMTMGRTASTTLMYALQPFGDIQLPSRLFSDCIDEELIHKDFIEQRLLQFGHLRRTQFDTPDQLVEAFYAYHESSDFVGFKSMPQYHDDYQKFTTQDDIFFITLRREDFASSIASFMMAKLRGTWRRFGGPVQQ